MKLVENLTSAELGSIAEIIGKAFVTNEMFREFGAVEARTALVMSYMRAYVQWVYQAKALYQSEDGQAYIGLLFSDEQAWLPKMRLMFATFRLIPAATRKSFLKFCRQVQNEDTTYTKGVHLEVLLVCIAAQSQGQGKARQLIAFAQQKAAARQAPLLFNTDMLEYAKIYEHFGCRCYHQKTAFNGVTRYNLVWKA